MGKFEKNFSLKMLTLLYFQKENFEKKNIFFFFMKKNFVILKEKVLLFFKKKKKIQILKEKVSFEQAKFEIGNKS